MFTAWITRVTALWPWWTLATMLGILLAGAGMVGFKLGRWFGRRSVLAHDLDDAAKARIEAANARREAAEKRARRVEAQNADLKGYIRGAHSILSGVIFEDSPEEIRAVK